MTDSRQLRNAYPSDVSESARSSKLPRAAWYRIAPFATWLGFMVLGQGLEYAGVARELLRWLYPVQALVVLAMLLCWWRHYDELRSMRLTPGQGTVAVAAGLIVLLLWVQLTTPWMTLGESAGFDPTSAGQLDWRLAIPRLLGAALVVPVMEELFWRSFLMRWIENVHFQSVDPARIGLLAFLISTLLFGIEHTLWLAGIVAGLAYGALYRWHGRLSSAILAHVVTNLGLGIWVLATGNWQFW